jgi:glycosyltransferase involved in cell wall biosynthesis
MRITVGLPVYNGADYLAVALDSILSQTDADFEIVVSEGGSTDATREILLGYAVNDPRVRYMPTPTKLTQVENCNRVLELARTEWVQFMCHDDVMLPGALRKICEAIQRCPDSVALVGHSSAPLFRAGLVYDLSKNSPQALSWSPGKAPFGLPKAGGEEKIYGAAECALRTLSLRACPPFPALTNAAVRKSALAEIGGFDSRFAQFDTRAWHRILLRHDYAYLPDQLSLTRIHGAQVTAKLKNQLRTTMDALRFWPEYIDEARAVGFKIPKSARWLPWIKAGSEAAAHIYMSLRKSQWAACLRMFRELPWRLKLISPFLLFRVWWAERRRVALFREHLSFQELYP